MEAASRRVMAGILSQTELGNRILADATCVVAGKEHTVFRALEDLSPLIKDTFKGSVSIANSLDQLEATLRSRCAAEPPTKLCIIIFADTYSEGDFDSNSNSFETLATATTTAMSYRDIQNVVHGHPFVMVAQISEHIAKAAGGEGEREGRWRNNDEDNDDGERGGGREGRGKGEGEAGEMQRPFFIEPTLKSIASAVIAYTETHLSCAGMMRDELMDDAEYKQEILEAVDEELESVAHLSHIERPTIDGCTRIQKQDMDYLTTLWKSAHTIKTTSHMISATKLGLLSHLLCELLRHVVHSGGNILRLDAREVWKQSQEYVSTAHTLRMILSYIKT